MDKWIFQFPSHDYSILSPNIWLDNIELFELTEIMRQAGDKTFAEALNNIREGNQTEDDITLITSRTISTHQSYPVEATHLLYYNKSVEQHNNMLFEVSELDKISYTATDIVIGDLTAEVKEKILQRAPGRAGDAMGLQKMYKTAVGLRNELTVNLDVTDGLVNVAGGKTTKISLSPTGNPIIIWIHFDSEDIGRELRQNSKRLYTTGINKNWTPIKKVERQFSIGKYKNAKVNRKQFPLQLSCAKTVHRSQGDTLQETVIQLPTERRAHVHYVALSRVTSLNNLHILPPFDPNKITVSDDVKQEMKRLRTEKQLQLCFTPIYTLPADHLTASDILMLVESRLCHTDQDFQLQGCQRLGFDFSTNRSPYGTIIFVKDHIDVKMKSYIKNQMEFTLLEITSPIVMNILCAYCRPHETWTHIHDLLTFIETDFLAQNTVVMGDFNTDNTKYQELTADMQSHQLNQLIQEQTTKDGTTIDLIYTNISASNLMYGVLESYYSHHKPIRIDVDIKDL